MKGHVYLTGTTGAPDGIPVRINNTVTGESTDTQVSAPPVDPGAYATTIRGSNGDVIIVRAWNATRYGETQTTIQGTTIVDVTLNLSRAPEPNITITTPQENSLFSTGDVFNVSVNVSILGAPGNCSVQLSFGNDTVLNLSGDTSPHFLGELQRGENTTTNFTVLAKSVGNSSITAAANCTPTGPLFEATTIDTLNNITVSDTTGPVVNLSSPPNGTTNRTAQFVNFTFTATDNSPINNCSLLLNGGVNDTIVDVVSGTTQNFSKTLGNGGYNWSVNCTDVYGNTGSGEVFILNISVFPPNITTISISNPVTLNAGTTKNTLCNVSVVDADGQGDIVSVNATLFFVQNTSDDPDNPNTHYTNTSCGVDAFFGNNKNFTCTFPLEYYARNGTWICNASATDSVGLHSTSNRTTRIDPLLALNVSKTFMDFGDIIAGFTSINLSQNVTNIGNRPLNLTVYGWGSRAGDNNAFVCTLINISVGYMKFAPNITALYTEKEPLSSSPKQARMTLPKQVGVGVPSTNTTYWQVLVPANHSDRILTLVFSFCLFIST